MSKAYWVVRGNVYDTKEYSKYIEIASNIISEFDGKFLVRGGEQFEFEIKGYDRTVIVEFNSYKDALDCYNSDKYQSALEIVGKSATRLVSIVKGI